MSKPLGDPLPYLGYLRLKPTAADTDFAEYNLWANKLNDFRGNFR